VEAGELWPHEDPTKLIQEAVHNYYAYRTKLNDLEFTRLMQQGATSLLIGLPILGACLLVIKLLLGGEAPAPPEVLALRATLVL